VPVLTVAPVAGSAGILLGTFLPHVRWARVLADDVPLPPARLAPGPVEDVPVRPLGLAPVLPPPVAMAAVALSDVSPPAIACLAGDEIAGERCRYRAEPGDLRRRALSRKQAPVGHDELDLERHPVGGGLPGDPLDEGVGHDLTFRPRIAQGVRRRGRPGQGSVHGHPLDDRQEPGHQGHRVGCRADADPPVGDRASGPTQR